VSNKQFEEEGEKDGIVMF